MVLTIVDLCMSVQSLADQTANSNSILNSNNNSKLSIKEHLWINQNDDDDIKSDNSEMKHFQPKIDRSTIAYGNLYQRNHSNTRADDDSDHKNFLMLNYLSDGEIERRIHFNGITAKETLVSNNGYGHYTITIRIYSNFISLFMMTALINLKIDFCFSRQL